METALMRFVQQEPDDDEDDEGEDDDKYLGGFMELLLQPRDGHRCAAGLGAGSAGRRGEDPPGTAAAPDRRTTDTEPEPSGDVFTPRGRKTPTKILSR